MDKKSFTLIELLIVIVIIGILAGLAIPEYKALIRKAKGAEAMRTLKTISESCWRYYLETGELYPIKGHSNDIPSGLDIQLPSPPIKNFLLIVAYYPGGDNPFFYVNAIDTDVRDHGPADAISKYGIQIRHESLLGNIQGEKLDEKHYRYYYYFKKKRDVLYMVWRAY